MSNREPQKEIKAVAFDIDGTLYSNSRLYSKIWFYFLKNLRFFLSYNKVRKVLHRTAVLPDFYEYQGRLLAEELKISKEEAKTLIETKVYKGLEPFFDNLKPFNFVKETFENMEKVTSKIKANNLNYFKIDEKFYIGDLEILPFSIPHDAGKHCRRYLHQRTGGSLQ